MKIKPLSLALASLLALRTATHAQPVSTRSGKLDFELGVPTKETVTKLYDEMDFQRACQLYLGVASRRIWKFTGHIGRHHRREAR